jgi:hypothetical protein
MGIDTRLQVIGYGFDAILLRYESVRLGSVNKALRIPLIAPYQLPDGAITSFKLQDGSMGVNQLAPGAVTASLPSAETQSLTPKNGWTIYNGSPISARKDAQGRVTLSGQITGGALDSAALTVPTNMRPGSGKVMLAASGGAMAYCRVTIDTAGNIKITTAYSDYVVLDGYYSAEKKKIKMSQKPKGVFTFVSNI